MDQTKLLLDTIVDGLQEKKGRNIVTVDLREMSGAICQYMVVCEGNNPNQITALSDSVWEMANRKMQEKPVSVDGLRNSIWIGMDYGTIIVHIFSSEARAFYRLESLWEDSKIIKIPDID